MENERTVINVTNPDGSVAEAEVLSVFNIEGSNKDYILYTFNKSEAEGMVNIHASILMQNEDEFSLENIESEDEWNKVKEVMRLMVQENKE